MFWQKIQLKNPEVSTLYKKLSFFATISNHLLLVKSIQYSDICVKLLLSYENFSSRYDFHILPVEYLDGIKRKPV